MLYDRDWAALPAHAQHSKSVRAQVLHLLIFFIPCHAAHIEFLATRTTPSFQPTSTHSNSKQDVIHTSTNRLVVIFVTLRIAHYYDSNILHYLFIDLQELTTGASLSISTAEVISGRVAEVEAPVGVCPFPHGLTGVSAAVVHASDMDMDMDAVDLPVPFRVPTYEEHSPLVQLLDGLDDTSEGAVDYMALADEVERWLAEEELQRNS
jgi:hypothetical protein